MRDLAPPGSFVDAGGHRLHVSCQGSGTPLILLESGVAASSLTWALVQPQLAQFTTACAYDRAGLAWSDVPSSPRTFTRIVEDLTRVLDHASSGGPVILVGHSFGSLLVRAFAARQPGNIAGLVLIDPPTEWIIGGAEQTRLLRGARQLSVLGAFLARIGVVGTCLRLLTGGNPGAPRHFVRIFGATAAHTLERLVGEVQKLPTELHPVLQFLWCQPKCFHAMANYLQVLEREGRVMAELSPPRSIPVTVISGGHQRADEIVAHQRWAAASERGRHVFAPESGHWIPFDQPEIIVDAVRDLIESERIQ